MKAGCEDPKGVFILAKCEEYVPGEVDTKQNIISCKIHHSKGWRKVIMDRWERNMSSMQMIEGYIPRYPDAIVGKPSRYEMQVKGTSYIVRFK